MTVLRFTGVTRHDLPADQVLEDALGKLDSAIVIGYDTEGGEYFCSSLADGGEVLWLLERCKHQLLQIADGDD